VGLATARKFGTWKATGKKAERNVYGPQKAKIIIPPVKDVARGTRTEKKERAEATMRRRSGSR